MADEETNVGANGDSGAAESQQDTQPTAPASMADAFSVVQAEAEAASSAGDQETPDAKPTGADAKSADAPTDKSKVQPPEKPQSVQSDLQRIDFMVRTGREDDLTPEQAGILRKIRERATDDARTSLIQEQRQEAEFRDLYLAIDAQRLEDPEGFLQAVMDEPDGAAKIRFYQAYKAAHPEVTVDNPNPTPKPKSEQEIRGSVDAEYKATIDEAVAAIAHDAGIAPDRVEALKAESPGRLSYMAAMVTEAAKVMAEKERPRIKAEERAAAEIEAQAKYAGRTIVTPRSVNGLPHDPSKQTPGSGITSMTEAFKQAVELQESAV